MVDRKTMLSRHHDYYHSPKNCIHTAAGRKRVSDIMARWPIFNRLRKSQKAQLKKPVSERYKWRPLPNGIDSGVVIMHCLCSGWTRRKTVTSAMMQTLNL